MPSAIPQRLGTQKIGQERSQFAFRDNYDLFYPQYPEEESEEDIAVVCDSEKPDGKGCKGAPDLVMEILPPSAMTGS